ncbi:hypothetical protein [Nocardia sp. NPDC058114]|uniref:DUF7373 family lipoprotein n=1 Tax=Nocardia sp. NPDC058114 TaxID=3346346 RepID=UPI0036DE2A85
MAASLALITFGISGCSSDEAPEVEQPAPVDISALDIGSYATAPRTIGKQNIDRARLTEGQRLGNYLPTPFEVDSRFKYQSGMDSNSVYGFIERIYTVGDTFAEDAPGFVGGFYSWAQSHDDILIAETLSNAAMIFDSEASASAAADALARSQRAKKEGRVAVQIPGFADEHAFWQPDRQELFTFKAYKQLVVYTTIKDYAKIEVGTTDLGAMTSMATKNWSTIQPRVDKFDPTAVGKLTDVELDHDQLLGHSLARQGEESQKNPPGIYNQQGALHITTTPESDRKLFETAGVEWLGINATELYQTKDEKGAELLSDEHSALNKKLRSAGSPKGLPAAQCNELKVKDSLTMRFHCTVAYGRYVIEARSNQLIDAQQRISAQYAMLAAKAK